MVRLLSTKRAYTMQTKLKPLPLNDNKQAKDITIESSIV